MATNPVLSKARKTVKALKEAGRLTDAEELHAALILDLAGQYPSLGPRDKAAYVTQIRALLRMLPPAPETQTTDAAQDFLDSFADE